MKVLIISPQIPYPYIGGAKMVTYNTLKYLSKNKVDITLLALGENDAESSNALKKYCSLEIVSLKTDNNYLKIIMNIFEKFIKWFELNLGWFFVNGMKQDKYCEYLKNKYK